MALLHAIKVAAKVVLVQISLLYLLGHLTLAFARLLGILQLQAVLVHGESHGLKHSIVRVYIDMEICGKTHLDALIVESQACANSVVESFTGLPRGVNIADLLALHVSMLAVQSSFNDAIADGLGDNVLGRLFATKVEADADVAQGNARVRQRHHADAGLDDVLTQTENQAVGAVAAEGVGVISNDGLEVLNLANPDGLDKEEVRVQRELQSGLAEGRSLGDIAHQQFNHQQKLGRRL